MPSVPLSSDPGETVSKAAAVVLTPSPVKQAQEGEYEVMRQHYEELKCHVTTLEVDSFRFVVQVIT